jgi:hypothetical protein
MRIIPEIIRLVGLAAATALFTLVCIVVFSDMHADAQSYQPYTNTQIIRQPMYTAPGMKPLITPPTQNPYAASQQYIKNLPTQQVQQCSVIPNGNGGYIKRCW